MVDRFWDIFLTARDGRTQCVYDMGRAPLYANGLGLNAVPCHRVAQHPVTGEDLAFTPGGGGAVPALGVTGYAISVVSTLSLETAAVDPWSSAIAAWVSDENYQGKVRFNCHGSPQGNLATGYKYKPTPTSDEISDNAPPETLASWLRANGLGKSRSAGGVRVLCLALCHAASHSGDPSASIIMRVAKQCQAERLFGLRLTGAAANVGIGPEGFKARMPSGVFARLAHTAEKHHVFVFEGASGLPHTRGAASAVHTPLDGVLTWSGAPTNNLAVGDSVNKGQLLGTVVGPAGSVELRSPRDGSVAAVNAASGSGVSAGQTLVVLSEPIKPYLAALMQWSMRQHH